MKKILSLIVAAALVFSVLPLGALAAPTAGEQLEKAPADTSARGRNSLYLWDFETDPLEDGWQFIDSDGDGYNWEQSNLSYHSGANSIMSESHHSGTALTPDNWAIVGPILLRDHSNELRFFARGLGSVTPDETFAVYIGESSDIEGMSELIPATVTNYAYTEYTADLDEYAGREIYLAVRHFNSDNKYYLAIDRFEVYGEYNEYVSTIEINDLTLPAWGETPDFEVTAGSDAYTVELVQWFDNSGEISSSFIFEDEANEFHAAFEVKANPGCVFSANTRVLINGTEELVNFYANECADDGSAFHTETAALTVEREIITEVEIEGFTAPVNGENPFYAVTAPEGANYSIGETNWYCGDDLVEPGTPFVYGNTYRMEIELIPNYGYKFGDELTASVNGDEALVDEAVAESPESAWVFTVEVEVAALLINEIAIENFVEPVWGDAQYFDITIPEGVNYGILEQAAWCYYDGLELHWLEEGELLDNEEVEYFLGVAIAPFYGYKIAENPSVTVNGENNNYILGGEVDGALLVYIGPFTVEPELIETVEILDLDIPEFGALADFEVSVPEGAAYSIERVRWFYFPIETVPGAVNLLLELSPGERFVAGYNYLIGIDLTANDGFAFVDGVYVTINGDESLVFGYYVYAGGSELMVDSIDFSFGEAIDEAGIEGFAEPVWGEAACYDYPVPEGANYSVDKVYWCYWDGEEVHFTEEGLIFDNEEYEYFMIVNLFADDGYYFGLECFYTVNGEAYEPFAWWSYDPFMDVASADGVRNRHFAVGPFTVTDPDVPILFWCWGDADGDGAVTNADALLLMRYLIGADTVEEENLALCDVNGDGEINLADALLIMRKAMGTIDSFPVEE